MKGRTSSPPQEEAAPPSRCPDNSAFKQQKLPAWKPQLTLASVLSSFFLTGAFCLTMGVCLVLSANSVREIQIDYSEKCSDCSKLRENSSNWNKECHCSVNFTLKEDILGDVFMYYGLQNFYQNHRRYMMSRSDAQLLGRNVNIQRSYCAPFSTYRNGTPMAPCGAIANSIFNDTIDLFYNRNSSVIQVPLLKTGNSWWTDKNVKFRNPKSYNFSSAFAGTARPPYWQKPVYLLDEDDERNNGYVNDDFIIWMRVSAFATFRNLYRRVRRVRQFAEGLPAGNYTFRISYNFPVSRFQGRKHVILSTVVWSGGSNPFLGIAYLVSGTAATLTGFVITGIHLKLRKKKTYFQKQ